MWAGATCKRTLFGPCLLGIGEPLRDTKLGSDVDFCILGRSLGQSMKNKLRDSFCCISGLWELGHLFPWVSTIIRYLWGFLLHKSTSTFMRKCGRDMNSFAQQLCLKLWPKEDWDHQSSIHRAFAPTWRRSLERLCWKLPLGSTALTSYCQVISPRWESMVLAQEG